MSFLPNIKLPHWPSNTGRGTGMHISKKLVDSAHAEVASILGQLNSTPDGLNQAEVEARLEQYGPNEVAKEKRRTWFLRLWDNVT